MSETKIKMFEPDSYEVRREYDLSRFKRLKGNRPVKPRRLKRILDSIKSSGYVPAPGIVNEFMEVIDGQGRLEACKLLKLPFYYTIVPGVGLAECIAMNINGETWKTKDYIASYAEIGVKDYVRLLDLMRKHPEFGVSIVLTAALGKQDHNIKNVKDGSLEFSAEQYELADKTLGYIGRYVAFGKDKKIPNMGKICEALVFLHYIDAVSDERMYRAFMMYYAELGGYSTTEQALDALEFVYNKNLASQNKVFVASEYRAYMANKLPWYEGRYGKHGMTRG